MAWMWSRVAFQASGLACVLLASAALSSAHPRSEDSGLGLQMTVLAAHAPEQVRRCVVEAGGARQAVSSVPAFIMLPTSVALAHVTCEAVDGRRLEMRLTYRPPQGWPVFVWIGFDDPVFPAHPG